MRKDVIAHSKDVLYQKPDWLEQRLAWFRSLQFGIILHWGPYSQWDCCESWALVPEDDWSRRDEITCWTDRAKDLKLFQRDYWNLPTTFYPLDFNPDKWVETFVEAGAKYVCFTTKHHDGFCMWDTKTTDYKITGDVCPFHRHPRADVTRELFDACRSAGLAVSVYFSKPDWHCVDYWDPDQNPTSRRANTTNDPEKWERFVQFTHAQIRELMTHYGKVDILWLDGGWVRGAEDIRMAEMVTMARELQPGLIVVNRAVGDEFEDYVTPERELPEGRLSHTWEACLPLCPDWKYVEGQVPRGADAIVSEIEFSVNHGGNFLLGIAPMPDGNLPPHQVQVLKEIGRLRAKSLSSSLV
jgi:alpha-L-fucosidase